MVSDKGLSGEETKAFFARTDLGLALIRPARKDEKTPRYFPTGCASGSKQSVLLGERANDWWAAMAARFWAAYRRTPNRCVIIERD